MALKVALEQESSKLIQDSQLQDVQLLNLRLQKAQYNLKSALRLYPEDELLDIQDRLLSVQYTVSTRLDEPHTSGANGSSTSGLETVAEEPQLLDELNMLSSEMQLRQRKLDKVDINSYHQDQLSSDLVDMAKTIKRNAELFQRKLDTDSDLVSTTTDALTRTAGSMSSVGQRLAKYRRETQLGWMFYIWSALFILISLVFGMTLIQLFGKW